MSYKSNGKENNARYCAKYRATHKKEIKAYHAKYYVIHKKELNARDRTAYRTAHRKEYRAYEAARRRKINPTIKINDALKQIKQYLKEIEP